ARWRDGAWDRRGGRAAARPRRGSGRGGEGPGAARGRARADYGRARGRGARGGWARGGGRRRGRGAGRARPAPNGRGRRGHRATRAAGGAAGHPRRMAHQTGRGRASTDRGRGVRGGGRGAPARGANGGEPRPGLGPEALADVPPADDGRDDERAAQVEALRARLARLGDVNPAALTELEELRARHEFLVGQRTDLERSLDDLRRTITKLIRTSRRRFEETFAGANEKLAEVFPKLFPGGKARLEQTEP